MQLYWYTQRFRTALKNILAALCLIAARLTALETGPPSCPPSGCKFARVASCDMVAPRQTCRDVVGCCCCCCCWCDCSRCCLCFVLLFRGDFLLCAVSRSSSRPCVRCWASCFPVTKTRCVILTDVTRRQLSIRCDRRAVVYRYARCRWRCQRSLRFTEQVRSNCRQQRTK